MADAFEVLGEEHDRLRVLLAELENGPATANEAQLRARRQTALRLISTQARHEAAEEELWWPAVRSVPGGGGLADQAVRQEERARSVLAALERTEAWDEGFEELVAAASGAARDHLAFEEDVVWPVARRALSEEDLRELGERLARAGEAAPTQPQPSTPPTPSGLRAPGKG
jgi:hemerythrin-like domain-containing protein